MEDRRTLIVGILAILCTALIFSPVQAYDNIAAHPMINRYAIDYFTDHIMPADPLLAGTSLNGAPARGLDWNLSDGRRDVPSEGIVSVLKYKSPALWMIEGGFSQDEPEMWQSLRHFFDPTNPQVPYLTDTWYLKKLGETIYGAEMGDPRTSAVDWAFSSAKGNDYSYPKAKEYFTQALRSDDRNTPSYGRAWRAVGETMHMVSDMAVPAHVRNDGHGIRVWVVPVNIDPYEESVNGKIVAGFAAYPGLYPPASLNYDSPPRTMMEELARFTNRHFISQDSNPSYTLPDLSSAAADNGYIMGTINGQSYHVAKKTSWLQGLVYETQLTNAVENNPKLDWQVISDQQKILIPTAVRADAAVLNRFLPRFAVNGEIKTSQEVRNGKPATLYFLDGEIVLKGKTEEWPEKLAIRNGASIVNSVTGKKIPVPVSDTTGDNLNSFRFPFVPADVGAKAKDTVYLEYDLGGYIVRSTDIEIPEEYPTPTQTARATVATTSASSSDACPGTWRQSIEFNGDRATPCERIMMSYSGTLSSGGSDATRLADPYKQAYKSCGCCQLSKSDFITVVIEGPGQTGSIYDASIGQLCRGETPAPTPRKITQPTVTQTPTPRPTACLNQGVSNRDCECLCRCYKDATERADCSKACSGGYAFSACPYG